MESNAQVILSRIRDNIERVIVGKTKTINLILVSLIAKGHVLIEDSPGLGKTKLATALARSIDAKFRRIQFTPDVLPSDITGFSIYNIHTGEKTFQQGAIMGQIVLADEINRASPKTQSAMLEAMQEAQLTVDGTTFKLPQPFMVIATQNPIETTGTFPLPEAQMDRFFMRVSLGYPTVENEFEVLRRNGKTDSIDFLTPVITTADIISLQNELDGIFVHDEIIKYIVRIADTTRTNEDIQMGVSPRGAIALMRAAMGVAVLSGRTYVIPDDVWSVVSPVLAHRIVLRAGARLQKRSPSSVLKAILKTVPVPVMV
jgi:MoxR-like ATPase